ncbi:hypothetical protein B0H17DRAFT_1129194 [Mycena rosella]|uniref:Uncharacterized protein n=1 Tax=Mycena rosella TaxID=1033263 RepID=A0AAD7GPP4_MYCRO|nr:hypothetical protein B0H17DRAFT_1129194 [Mycena rosella]
MFRSQFDRHCQKDVGTEVTKQHVRETDQIKSSQSISIIVARAREVQSSLNGLILKKAGEEHIPESRRIGPLYVWGILGGILCGVVHRCCEELCFPAGWLRRTAAVAKHTAAGQLRTVGRSDVIILQLVTGVHVLGVLHALAVIGHRRGCNCLPFAAVLVSRVGDLR